MRGDCKRKYTASADQPRFSEHAKRQAVQMSRKELRSGAKGTIGLGG